MTVYRVTAERTAKWWVLQAVDAPGAISQVSRLDQADQIKEAISFVTGEPEDEIEYVLEPVLPKELAEEAAAIELLREQARAATEEALFRSRTTAQAMRTAFDYSIRDVGVVLHVSHQRAHQLANEATDEAWQRLSEFAKRWLIENPRATVVPEVWAALQEARFVDWWGKQSGDNHALDASAWNYILSHAADVPDVHLIHGTDDESRGAASRTGSRLPARRRRRKALSQ